MSRRTKKTDDKQQDALEAFTFHGLVFRETSTDQAITDCLFCGKEQKLYVNSESGMWDCKVCGASGNAYTFLHMLHDVCWKSTTTKDYKALGELRGLPYQVFEQQQLAVDGKRWLLPGYNEDGSICNLYTWEAKRGARVLSTPGCAHHLINEQVDFKKGEPVYVCEGHWDTYAMEWLLKKCGKPGAICGVPGAETFKNSWVNYFSGHNVVLLYDNDSPGANGMKKATRLLAPVANSIKQIDWPSSAPAKYDISDLIGLKPKAPKQAFALITAACKGIEKTERDETEKWARVAEGKPPAFSTLARRFKKDLHMDKRMEEALAVCLAVVLSNRIPGDPLWIFLVGPPGAGKTIFLKAVGHTDHCHFESNLTTHSLVSGFIPRDGEDDPSLIKRLKGKCLVLKDYTEVKSLPIQAQEEIYGTLRGAYDGTIERTFGNNRRVEYPDCYFSMVAGVTDIINSDARATLGERFLRLEFAPPGHDNEGHIRAAVSSMRNTINLEHELAAMCKDFLDQDLRKVRIPVVTKALLDVIIPLVQIIAYLRANVARTYRGEVEYRSRPEIASRLARQMVKMCQSLCFVYDKTKITPEIYRIVERIALDTARGYNVDILHSMMMKEPVYMSLTDISDECNIPPTTVKRRLDDLMELDVVYRRRVHDGSSTLTGGQPPYGYRVSEHMVELWKRAKLPSRTNRTGRRKRGKA